MQWLDRGGNLQILSFTALAREVCACGGGGGGEGDKVKRRGIEATVWVQKKEQVGDRIVLSTHKGSL